MIAGMECLDPRWSRTPSCAHWGTSNHDGKDTRVRLAKRRKSGLPSGCLRKKSISVISPAEAKDDAADEDSHIFIIR